MTNEEQVLRNEAYDEGYADCKAEMRDEIDRLESELDHVYLKLQQVKNDLQSLLKKVVGF